MCLKYFTDILSEVTTWCNHDPTPEPGIVVQTYDVLFNTTSNPTEIYLYNPTSKSSTLLSIPDILRNSVDVSHTSNKLWLYQYIAPNAYVREWDIVMSPFSATYNRDITNYSIPVGSAGLCAKDDLTLISVKYQSVILTEVYECDITTDASSNTHKFDVTAGRQVSGDYFLTTTDKLIISTYTNSNGDLRITQYDYLTGNIEVDILISPTITSPFGLFEFENEIYVTNIIGVAPNQTSQIYKIDKTAPYSLTLYDTVLYAINGASQIPEQLTVHFT